METSFIANPIDTDKTHKLSELFTNKNLMEAYFKYAREGSNGFGYQENIDLLEDCIKVEAKCADPAYKDRVQEEMKKFFGKYIGEDDGLKKIFIDINDPNERFSKVKELLLESSQEVYRRFSMSKEYQKFKLEEPKIQLMQSIEFLQRFALEMSAKLEDCIQVNVSEMNKKQQVKKLEKQEMEKSERQGMLFSFAKTKLKKIPITFVKIKEQLKNVVLNAARWDSLKLLKEKNVLSQLISEKLFEIEFISMNMVPSEKFEIVKALLETRLEQLTSKSSFEILPSEVLKLEEKKFQSLQPKASKLEEKKFQSLPSEASKLEKKNFRTLQPETSKLEKKNPRTLQLGRVSQDLEEKIKSRTAEKLGLGITKGRSLPNSRPSSPSTSSSSSSPPNSHSNSPLEGRKARKKL